MSFAQNRQGKEEWTQFIPLIPKPISQEKPRAHTVIRVSNKTVSGAHAVALETPKASEEFRPPTKNHWGYLRYG